MKPLPRAGGWSTHSLNDPFDSLVRRRRSPDHGDCDQRRTPRPVRPTQSLSGQARGDRRRGACRLAGGRRRSAAKHRAPRRASDVAEAHHERRRDLQGWAGFISSPAFVRRHGLGLLEGATSLKVGGDAGRARKVWRPILLWTAPQPVPTCLPSTPPQSSHPRALPHHRR